jgi:hypothetical protein
MQVVAEATQQAIDEARVGYQSCGAYNAVLFFCIRDMVGNLLARYIHMHCIDAQAVQMLSPPKHFCCFLPYSQSAWASLSLLHQLSQGCTLSYHLMLSVVHHSPCTQAGIDPMYQYSLGWFIQLFVRSIQVTSLSQDIKITDPACQS